jgi:hypothetical protein
MVSARMAAAFCALTFLLVLLTFPRRAALASNDNVGAPEPIPSDGPLGALEQAADEEFLHDAGPAPPPSAPAADPVHPKSVHSYEWFAHDPPGIDLNASTSIWSHELSLKLNASRDQFARKHPQLVFIKGLKVGGTSVALALDNVARAYGIQLQDTVSLDAARKGALPANVPCARDRSLFFHHAQKEAWMKHCVPYARFVTLLREPVSQALSWESMTLNRNYFVHYPTKNCSVAHKFAPGVMLSAQLRKVEHCVDAEFRSDITLHMVAAQVRSWNPNNPGMSVAMTARWVAGMNTYMRISAKHLVKLIDQEYFLVGVTDRLNEFLVLLALHQGWDPSRMYYMKCKPQYDVTVQMFGDQFPELLLKLQKASVVMREAYQYAKAKFDSHVAQLGPWFPRLVGDFEIGLKKYQKEHELKENKFKWRVHRYLDGEWEYC